MIGTAFTLSAFTEPAALPADTSSYPPINLGPATQYHYGSLCLGNGSSKVDNTLCSVGSLAIKSNLLLDRMTVRQNANFVEDVTVDNRNIVAGLIRAPQVVLDSDTNNGPGHPYTTTPQLYFPIGATTNLISGNYCTTAANTACWPGSVLYKYDPSTGKSTCRYINPVKSPINYGSCPLWWNDNSISLYSSTPNTSTCLASTKFTLGGGSGGTTANSGGVGGSSVSTSKYYWFLRAVGETDWVYLGQGYYKISPAFNVPMKSISPTKAYDIRVNEIVTVVGTNGFFSETGTRSYQRFADVNTVQESMCP
jgi:hypothetical protein